MRHTTGSSLLLIALLLLTVGCGTPSSEEPGHPQTSQSSEGEGPVEFRIRPEADTPPIQPDGIVSIEVPAWIKEPRATYRSSLVTPREEIKVSDPPLIANPNGKGMGWPASDVEPARRPQQEVGKASVVAQAQTSDHHETSPKSKLVPLAPALDSSFDAADFDTNGDLTPSLFIPPDPHAAAGPDHLINVANVLIEFYQKDGSLDFRDSLRNFFTALTPLTYTFDPKVIYDQYAGRFVVVTLEQTSSPETSRLLVAVSDDSNPNGTWYLTAINSRLFISSEWRWADYPGFGLDPEAIYITSNMFNFAGTSYGGVRLWAIDKGLGGGGFYDGGPASVVLLDPYGGPGIATTTQPAHLFGSPPAGVNTFLVSYSGLNGGGNEFVQVVRLDDALGSPVFTQQYVSLGNIESTTSGLPDAPQTGTGILVETNDRRALNAVWRDGSLWMVATTRRFQMSGSYQTFATWWQLDTSNLAVLALADMGFIDGEDIATGTFTFFPSIAVTSTGEVAIGFSASAPTIYPGSYYTTRSPGDPAGTTSGSAALRAGIDWYWRQFGGSRNRWGDYSGISIDPADECFWIYNEHAITRGTVTTGGQDGRWGTAHGRACACDQSAPLTATKWKQVSLACNQGNAVTVAEVFGDDLNAANYGSTWGMYAWDPMTHGYGFMSVNDTLATGTGYWISTHNAGQTVDCQGVFNAEIEVPLTSDPDGRFNMVGHPFEFDVCWADAEVIDSDDTVLSLAQSDPSGVCQMPDPVANGCRMSRVAYKYTGDSYESFDGAAPGLKGTLVPFDGFWVKAYKPGIKLRVPALPGSSCESAGSTSEAGATHPGSWYIRLIASTESMRDAGAVLGRAQGSRRGYDAKDLPRLRPFGSNYLNVVFPRPQWFRRPGEYASDFRPLDSGGNHEIWPFEVRTSAIGEEITLSWDGPRAQLDRAFLWDQDARRSIPVRPGESYTFTATSGIRNLLWIQSP